MRIFLNLAGACSLLYGMGSLTMNRLNTGVAAFLIIGIFFLLAAFFWGAIQSFLRKRKMLRTVLMVTFAAGICTSALLEGLILWGMKEQKPAHIDYIVVLGAGVKSGQPTPVLRARLDKAIEIHREYPETTIYVTGGLDPGESLTEGDVMKEYLLSHGIHPEKVVKETKATSTEENFAYTKEMMPIKVPKVMVVSSDFHLYRAKFYAKKHGFEPYSAGAPIPPSLIPLTHFREILAVAFMAAKEML